MKNSNNITYNGRDIFKVDFGLYGVEVRRTPTMATMMREFKFFYTTLLREQLPLLGLKYKGLKWYSPREYNYSNDSIDLVIEVVDAKKYLAAVKENEKEINALLAANKSYDGYMALTVDSVDAEIQAFQGVGGEQPDPIILGYLIRQKIDFSDYEPEEFYTYYIND